MRKGLSAVGATISVLVSLGTVIVLVSVLSTREAQRIAEENNFTVNSRAGFQAEAYFKSVQTVVLFYLEMLERVSAATYRDPETEAYFFDHNENVAAVWVKHFYNNQDIVSFIPNKRFLLFNGISVDSVEVCLNSDLPVAQDRMMLFNESHYFQFPLVTAVFVRQSKMGIETVKVLFTPEELSDSFGTGINTSFIISGSGDVLIHPVPDLVLGGANFSSLPIVAAMQQTGDKRCQTGFSDNSGRYFGACYRIAGTDASVITTIPHNLAFEAVHGITRQNLFLAAAVLFIAIIFIWFFPRTISGPVRVPAGAVLRETKPGGLPKHATILFSGIRGFAEKSKNFTNAFGNEASNRIVMWLNEYFTRMAYCVEKTGGVLDKFIGDAVMAHWGTAYTAGSPAVDAFNCVKAALMMRISVVEFNARRAKNDPGNPEIRISCGINTGVLTAGQIGSEQRMEYTVIGDPVNLASRTKALNMPLGTDIMITENTWKLVGDKFITEEMPPLTVKGKEKPVRVFAVVNFRNFAGPKTLAELKTLLGP